jgi:predicted nucleic acid-binding protein
MKTLYDTDFLLSLLVGSEPNHAKSLVIDRRSDAEEFYILNIAHFEMATVLSRKYNQEFALKVLVHFSALPFDYIELTEDDEEEAWKEFYSHKKKNVSFVDCANLVIARKYGMKIASFDAFYPSGILLK